MLNVNYKTLIEIKEHIGHIEHPTILVLNKSSAERWDLANAAKNKNIVWVSQVESNPTPKTLYNAMLKVSTEFKCSEIIAIGGGSALDLAKGIIAFLKEIQNITSVDYIRKKIKDKAYLKNDNYDKILFTAVPTTAGTGSEATQWATIWDDSSPAKFSIDAPWLTPDKIILSADFTLGAPLRLTAATGLDAVSHSVEAYWAKASDSLSKQLALSALSVLVPGLYNLLENYKNDNLEWREKLATGACISGLAFSRTRTTACHSISYPLTSLFGVEHGFAVAITLSQVAEINSKAVNLDKLFAIFEPYGGIEKWIESVTRGVVEMKLSYFGINKDDITTIVENAVTGGRMDNNPVEIDKNSVEQILIDLL